MLKEVGFQANQHEILADNFCKMQCKSVHESAKRLKEQKKRNVKEAERVGAELKTAYKHMEAARDKFRKAWDEQEKAAAAHQRAAADGAITRNEVRMWTSAYSMDIRVTEGITHGDAWCARCWT